MSKIYGNAGAEAKALIAKQKIDEYNKNPNLCLCCNKPIFAPYNKKLGYTTVKKFCSKSCAAKYNNINKIKNINGINNSKSIIDNLTDIEIIEAFNNSNNITEFSKNLGYKTKIDSNNIAINNRLSQLNLSLKDLKKRDIVIANETKGDLFNRYSKWQTARSAIQKNARKIYEQSDKPKQCVVCGYNKHYEVAHIKAVSDFDDDALISEINNEDNLIALCPNHHWEYDNDNMDIILYL